MRTYQPLTLRILDRIGPETETGCWPWTGTVNRQGYAHIIDLVRKRTLRVIRLVLEGVVGNLPASSVVCHRCDNPACVNPDHLFAGTQSDNMRDASRKGRMNVNRPRDLKPSTKIREAEIAEVIRLHLAGSTGRTIAAQFGVDPSTISLILRGRGYQKFHKRKKGDLHDN